MSKSIVAIVGRPNVGKSTFFNRCIGARHAIVDDSPGVTRDRIYHETDWSGHEFLMVDTGGILFDAKAEFAGQVFEQVKLALDEADVIVFMVDGKAGLQGTDVDVANVLRRAKKPILLAVNKVDEPKEQNNVADFYELGLGEPQALSALRGSGGVGDLLDKIIELLPEDGKKNGKKKRRILDDLPDELDPETFEQSIAEEEAEEIAEADLDKVPFSIAIVGKPNVGKSSMINYLCGKERTIVSATPGTTRDAIDTLIDFQGREITLTDTAGIRRRNRVDYGIEAFSVVRSLKAMGRSDVVALMIDAAEELTDQDHKIAGKIEEAGKAAVLVVNKWDLIENKSSRLMNEFTAKLRVDLRALSFAEIIYTSAVTHQRATKIIEASARAFKQARRRVSTGLLNQIINEAIALVPPPSSKRGKRLRIYYSTQASVAPPTFVLFANDRSLMTKNYEVYLERKLRESFGFEGAPIRLITRSKRV
jgi:GTP-binding protein